MRPEGVGPRTRACPKPFNSKACLLATPHTKRLTFLSPAQTDQCTAFWGFINPIFRGHCLMGHSWFKKYRPTVKFVNLTWPILPSIFSLIFSPYFRAVSQSTAEMHNHTPTLSPRCSSSKSNTCAILADKLLSFSSFFVL